MEKFVGAKYDINLSSKEIKEKIKKDLDEAIKNGSLPKIRYSIRRKSFSGGTEIAVIVRRVEGIQQDQSVLDEIKKKIEEIGNAYNRIEDDPMTDYYSTNYFFDVRFELR